MFIEMNYRSSALNRNTQVYVILPRADDKNQAPCKVMWLLHGLSGDHTSWLRNTSIERYVAKHNLAVIMPNVNRSWYTDTAYDGNYFTFVSKELPTLCYNTFAQLSQKREDNIVAGLSMGGYGAVKLALSYPEQYGTCISLSGSLDITRKGRPCNLNEWKSIFGFDLQSPLELEGSRHDLFALASINKEKNLPFPNLYLWCGTEDSLIEVNRCFDRHLSSLDVEHTFTTSEGDHSWKWWDLHIQNALNWMLEKNIL